jgi:hypothetical protein
MTFLGRERSVIDQRAAGYGWQRVERGWLGQLTGVDHTPFPTLRLGLRRPVNPEFGPNHQPQSRTQKGTAGGIFLKCSAVPFCVPKKQEKRCP